MKGSLRVSVLAELRCSLTHIRAHNAWHLGLVFNGLFFVQAQLSIVYKRR